MPSTTHRSRRRARRQYSAAERAEYRSRLRSERFRALQLAINELRESAGWRRWLEMRARFHTYSVSNTLLIALQCPSATQVAGMRAWEAMGRRIKRGEHGIRIWAPMRVRVRDAEGNETDEVKLWFRVVYVWDISQTEGEPLPALTGCRAAAVLQDDSHAGVLTRLRAWAESQGISVQEAELPHGTYGSFNPRTRAVTLAPARANSQLYTLLHELAHAQGIDYARYGRPVAEMIVESAAYVVGRALGLDATISSAAYVAQWHAAASDTQLVEHAKTIDQIAATLEAACGLREPTSRSEDEHVAAAA